LFSSLFRLVFPFLFFCYYFLKAEKHLIETEEISMWKEILLYFWQCFADAKILGNKYLYTEHQKRCARVVAAAVG
jgi:hypothetical protein